MKKTKIFLQFYLSLFFSLLLIFCCFSCSKQKVTPGDLVLLNGKIFTADENHPAAEALAINGNKITAVFVTGTDFGMQTGAFISNKVYRDLYMPFHKIVNDWIHKNTNWKSFIHSCGSVWALINDFIEAGFDILNPVQCSAAGMEPVNLKKKFGDRISFWGGAIDTQKTLPFGTPDEVRREVIERIKIFGPGGGFIFNAIHNIQARTPVENLIALFDTFNKYRNYPL